MKESFHLDIVVEETAGFDRINEPIRVCIPVPPGEISVGSSFVISTPDNSLCNCQTRPLKNWPCGSVKWLLVDSFVSVARHSKTILKLFNSPEHPRPKHAIKISESKTMLVVDTGAGQFHIDTSTLKPFIKVLDANGEPLSLGSECTLISDHNSNLKPYADEISIEDGGPLHAIIVVAGHFGESKLRFQSRIHFYAGTLQVKYEMTLHNPKAATHPQGLWDLGDRGSIEFQGLSFSFFLPENTEREFHCFPYITEEPITGKAGGELSIYQESSGGENWQSPNHRNKQGLIPLTFRGFKAFEGGRLVKEGYRATPLAWSGNKQKGTAATIPLFWQQFPKKLIVEQNKIQIELFPACFPDLFEMQGGEQKTHQFYLDFSVDKLGLRWSLSPLAVMASPGSYHESSVIGDLPGRKDLVDQFASAGVFFRKREAIDEFGWRNFGDVYADHEAVQDAGNNQFISHYNNQYDLISGFYRKAFSAGDLKWQELACDLANHVVDIDLYHTELDREEYNHGLFWHTDHYTDAGLSTHRSYSKEQVPAYERHNRGGGPGNEHCYSSGLALHYYLTADPKFKHAVIDLAQWGLISLKGPQTVLGAIKRLASNLRQLKDVGKAKVAFPCFPFTRGTGNVITACLDAFELTDDKIWLNRAGKIIKSSLHPFDDIQARTLENIEISWSYVVLLASIGKFLDVKNLYGELDVDFEFARRSLQVYATWMAKNEYSYLDKPEILEYPNETWAAQELRKSVVFYYAAKFADNPSLRSDFLKKGIFFHNIAKKSLSTRGTANFTRPVALMLQNCWAIEKLKFGVPERHDGPHDFDLGGKATPYLTLTSVLKRFVTELVPALSKTSLKKEVGWLLERLKA